jgi:hypothetical protein
MPAVSRSTPRDTYPPAAQPLTRTQRARRRELRRRRIVVVMFVCAALMVATYVIGAAAARGPQARVPAGADATGLTGAAATPPATPPAEPSPAASPEPVLSLPGDFPTTGPGTFAFSPTGGEVLGESGPVRRFRVAVEDGVDELARFTAAVDATLGDRRSWPAGGDVRLQRVDGSDGYDFTIFLATAGTAGQLCLGGGIDVRIGGEPYTSCRTPGQVIINLSRWRLSVPHFVDAEVPLDLYRQYVINHEVGHELGYNHEACVGAGEPAPVMQQQTLFLDGCEANQWPYLDGQRYAGPPAP